MIAIGAAGFAKINPSYDQTKTGTPAPICRSLLGLLIDHGFRDPGERGVRGLLLLSRVSSSRPTACSSPSSLAQPLQRAVARDFVVLDGLRSRQQSGVEGGGILVVLHDLLAFLDDADDGLGRFCLEAFLPISSNTCSSRSTWS